jgi:hypothetical protein
MGEWKAGKRNGQGVLITSDGSMEGSTTFIGSFTEGRSAETRTGALSEAVLV